MKIEKRDGSIQKRILIGMIVDSVVLSRISPRWEKDLFASKWANIVSKWCNDYFLRHGKAPYKSIQALYEVWAEDAKDETTASECARFLEGISDEYRNLRKESNSEHIIDMAKQHFDKVKATRLAELIQGDVENGDLDKALGRIGKFSQVGLGGTTGIDLFLDRDIVLKAFDAKAEPLVKYPGDLGRMFGSALSRDSLIAFMGPEKVGKTWWLMDLAWRAALQRKRVAFFETGDLSEDEVIIRFGCRAARKPIEKGTVAFPILFEPDYPISNVEHEQRVFDEDLTKYEAWNAIQSTLKNKLRTERSFLKIFCYPNTTISVHGIASVLKDLDNQGWPADVVVIDYADILAPISGTADSRDQINMSWKAMKALTQIHHCLVATATQTDADSYGAYLLDLDNFSEDKRKYAHVNGMIGINCTSEEQELGLYRLNWMLLRGAKYNRKRCVHTAGCLGFGNPAVKNGFPIYNVREPEKKKKKKKGDDE